MKKFKKKTRGFIALLMTLAMLVGVCLPAGADSFGELVDSSSAGIAGGSDSAHALAYSLTIEDGKIVLAIDPDMVYDILKDKDISKEELKSLIPQDILDAAAKGKDLTIDDLKALASNYVTLDELKALINDMPRDIIAEYISVEKLQKIITVEEILNVIPLEDLMNAVEEEALRKLLTDEVMELMFKDELVDKIATDAFVSDLMNNTTLVEDITTDPVIKAKLLALVTDEIVDKMMADNDIKTRLYNYIETSDVGSKILHDEAAVEKIFNVLTDDAHQTKLDSFITNGAVEDKLLTKENILDEAIIDDLIEGHIIDHNVLTIVFEPDELRQLINDDVVEALMGDETFVQSAVSAGILDTIMSKNLILDLAKVDEIKALFTPEVMYDLGVTFEQIAAIDGAIDLDEAAQILQSKNVDVGILINSGALALNNVDYADLDAEGWITADDISYFETENIYVTDPESLTPDNIKLIVNHLCSRDSDPVSLTAMLEINGISLDVSKIDLNDDFSGDITLDDLKPAVDTNKLTVDAFLDDTDFYDKVVYFTQTNPEFRSKVVSTPAARDAIAPYINAEINNPNFDIVFFVEHLGNDSFGVIASHIDHEKVVELLENADESVFNDLMTQIDHTEVVHAISDATMKSMIKANMAIFNDTDIVNLFVATFDPLNDSDIVDALGGVSGIVMNYCDIKVIIEDVIGVDKLFEIFSVQDVVSAVGADTLMDYCDVKDVIAKAGGPAELAKLYSNDELTAIVKAIGTDNITAFVRESGILDVIDVKAIANDVIDLIKDKAPAIKAFIKESAETTIRLLMTRVDGIYFNGAPIFSNGQFDINALLVSMIRAIPDVDDLLAIETDGAMFNALLSFDIKYDDSVKTFSYGFEAKFNGDPSALQSLIKDFSENFRLDVTDELDVTLAIALPEVVADLYETVLTSDRVPERIKDQLVTLPDMTVAEVVDVITDIAKNDAVFTAINEKLDAIKAKAYEKIDARLSDNAMIDKAKAKVDELLDRFVTKENYDKAVNKGIALLDKITANFGGATPIQSLYEGSGVFGFEKSFSVDFLDVIGKFISLPEEAAVLFKSTVISGSLDASVGVDGMYQLTVVDEYGDEFVTYLPAGISLDVLTNATGLEVVDENAEKVLYMPASDSVLNSSNRYYVQFVIDGNVVENVFYTIGDTTVTEPDLDTLEWEGKDTDSFTYAWEEYELNKQQVTVVNMVATPVEKQVYNVYWYVLEGDMTPYHTAQWTFGDATTYPTHPATDPTRDGYTFKGWDTELTADLFATPGDIEVYATWEAVVTPPTAKITVTFVDEQGTTLGTKDFDKGTAEADVLAYAQTTFPKEGYTVSISGYDPNGAAAQTVTVKYTAIGGPSTDGSGADDTTDDGKDIADGDDDGTGSKWWIWLIILLIVLIIAAIVIAYFATRPTPEAEETPETEVAPEPEPEPVVVPEPEAEPEVEAPVEEEIHVIDHVSVEEVDELMTDDTAMHLVATKKVAAVAGGKAIVNLAAINAAFEAGETVNLETLKAKKLVPSKTGKVKILASGNIDKALNVEASAFSVQSIKMITLTGGTVTQVVSE